MLGSSLTDFMSEMEIASAHVHKITITDHLGMIRSFKKILCFEELKERIGSFYPTLDVLLMRANSTDVVGSQDELYFAYKEVPVECQTMCLYFTADTSPKKTVVQTPNVASRSNSRTSNESSSRARTSDDESPTTRRGYPWDLVEVSRFKEGVANHGWGSWKLIAEHIGTRDRKQVRAFSISKEGSRLRPESAVSPMHPMQLFNDSIESSSLIELRPYREGRWDADEIAGFKHGLETHGWGDWKRISEVIGTRTRKQVQKFSVGKEGKRLADELSALSNLNE